MEFRRARASDSAWQVNRRVALAGFAIGPCGRTLAVRMDQAKRPPASIENDSEIDEAIVRLCRRIEAMSGGAAAGVCIASADRSQIVRSLFPSVPTSFQSAIKNIPMAPPYFGACNAVIAEAKVVTCHDMTRESRFDEQFVRLCVEHGVMALQSRPVMGKDGRPLGTFVMAYRDPRDERDFDAALMELGADGVSAVLCAVEGS